MQLNMDVRIPLPFFQRRCQMGAPHSGVRVATVASEVPLVTALNGSINH